MAGLKKETAQESPIMRELSCAGNLGEKDVGVRRALFAQDERFLTSGRGQLAAAIAFPHFGRYDRFALIIVQEEPQIHDIGYVIHVVLLGRKDRFNAKGSLLLVSPIAIT